MRKNIASVIDAFHAEETYRDKTCSTDGRSVRSYAQLIAVRHNGAVYVLDVRESPSRTTSSQIRAVQAAFPDARIVGGRELAIHFSAPARDREAQARRGLRAAGGSA
jgi:hypothetical protein